MDIASVSMTLANMDVLSKVGTAVLDNALESNETMAAGMVEIIDAAAMERSVNPHIGGNIDMRV